MKGRILGFDGNTGAISAEDGQRFSFTLADWKADRAAQPNMAVDFVADGANAREIYVTGGAFGANLAATIEKADFGALAASPEVAKTKSAFTQGLAAPLAVLVILACFLPALSLPEKSFSLIGLGELAAVFSAIDSYGGSGGGVPGPLLLLRFAAPLAALWLLYRAFTGKPTRLASLAAAAGCVLAVLIVITLRASLYSIAGSFGGGSAAIPLGLGVWVLGLCAIALVLAALGKLRNPLAHA